MILIGSRALNYYIPLNRVMHDWDLIMSQKSYESFDALFSKFKVKETDYSIIYDIKGEIFEVRNPKTLDDSDQILLNNKCDAISTPVGWINVPSLDVLYDIKVATASHIKEPKHSNDVKLMEEHYPYLKDRCSDFYIQRYNEIEERVKKSNKIKYDFFHKYHIPEYIYHDRLHDMIADLLDLNIPTYKRITVADTDISEECFSKLTHAQKVSLMMEESLVLNLERWFIPQMIENGINYRLIDKFYNNNEAMPTYLILKHVCLTGLKGEATWITEFSRANFFEIEKEWQSAKIKIKEKGGFPTWFYNELFDIRNRFKKGEKVALV